MSFPQNMMNILKERIIKNKYIPTDHKKPLPTQARFLCNMKEEVLFGGQAGGGKSDALLMSALMFVDYPDYNALLFRRTFPDLDMPGAIMNRSREWLAGTDAEWSEKKKRWTFPSGATLTFGHLQFEKDKYHYQGAELQYIGFDELTQFTESQYTYLHSRLRKGADNPIPLRMRAGSNPGGIGHGWVKERFISENSNLDYIPSNYTENKYLDIEEYGRQLDKLPRAERLQLKYGNWDLLLEDGLLVTRSEAEAHIVTDYPYTKDETLLNLVSVDLAGEGKDKTALISLNKTTGGLYMADTQQLPDSKIEARVLAFIQKQIDLYNTYGVVFELEPGSNSEYSYRYWKNLIQSHFPNLLIYKMRPTKSKFERTRLTVKYMNLGQLFFVERKERQADKELDVTTLINQLMYVNPDPEVMKQYPSPDLLDALNQGVYYMDQWTTSKRKNVRRINYRKKK